MTQGAAFTTPAVSQVRVPPRRGAAHQAAETRRLAGQEGGGHPGRPDGSPVDPGDLQLEGHVVDEKAGLEVVQPVDDDVRALDQLLGVRPAEVGDHALYLYLRVSFAQMALGGLGLGEVVGDVLSR